MRLYSLSPNLCAFASWREIFLPSLSSYPDPRLRVGTLVRAGNTSTNVPPELADSRPLHQRPKSLAQFGGSQPDLTAGLDIDSAGVVSNK